MITSSIGTSIFNKGKLDIIKQSTGKEFTFLKGKSSFLESPVKMKLSRIDYDDDFTRMMRSK